MSQLGSSKAERGAVIAVSIVVAVGVIGFSVWSRSWFGIIAYVIFVAIPSTFILLRFFLLRSRKLSDSEIQDKMMKAKTTRTKWPAGFHEISN